MKKRIIAVFTVLLLIFSLSGCGEEKVKTVKVPDLVGVELKYGLPILEKLKLIPSYTWEDNNSMETGVILWTNQKAGTMFKNIQK